MLMQIEITARCNFRCAHCPQSVWLQPTAGRNAFARQRSDITERTWRIALDNAQRYADTLTLGFFGEQMAHPAFADLLRMIPTQRRYRTVLFTNFSLATERTFAVLREHIDNVRISIDAATAGTFDRMRPGGPVIANSGNASLDRFGELERKVHAWLRGKHPSTALMFLTSSINKHERAAFVERWRPHLARRDCIVTKRVISYGGVMHDDNMRANACKVHGERRMSVAWDGRLTPCNLDVDLALCVGDLHDQQDIGKVMASQRYADTLQAMRDRRGVCANCFDANNRDDTEVHINEAPTD